MAFGQTLKAKAGLRLFGGAQLGHTHMEARKMAAAEGCSGSKTVGEHSRKVVLVQVKHYSMNNRSN